MTWQTPVGERTLDGAEAALVRDLLACMVDRISVNLAFPGDPIWDFGVYLFDELTPSQQLSVVGQIATHLLTATKATLELSAINESAVYVVFHTLAIEIEKEIDRQDDPLPEGYGRDWSFHWRSRTLQAYRNCLMDDEADDEFEDDDPESEWRPPCDERSRNLPQWRSIAENLADRILWDRDFEMASDFLDGDPMRTGSMKQLLGMEDDFFSDVAADVMPGHVDALLESVRSLTHKKPR